MSIRKFAILLTPVLLLVAVAYFLVKPVAVSAPGKTVVVIDAGHGGIDGGVVGKVTKAKEADLNLEFAKQLKEVFSEAGFSVVLTRTTSGGLYGALTSGFKLRDLSARVNIAKECGADVFISVHMNEYSDGSRRGAQVFYKIADEKSERLANSVQTSLNLMPECVKRTEALPGDYYVLNNSPCPAVIVECGFLSNAEDEKLLLTNEYRASLSRTVLVGVVGYFEEAGRREAGL